MRVWLFVVAVTGVGIATGIGTAYYEVAIVPRQFEPHNATLAPLTEAEAQSGAPRALIVGGKSFDFGSGQRYSHMKHTFTIRNAGTTPLVLKQGATSCKCTWTALEKGSLAPAESAEITLEWQLQTEAETFRQTAEIHTNDRQQPTVVLDVHGTVLDRVKVEPKDVVLSDLSASEENHVDLTIFGYDRPDLEVVEHTFTNQENASFFELEFEQADPASADRTPPPTALLRGALTIKSGLPLGPLNQTIRLKTNIPDLPELEVAIGGRVVSDISIVGPGKYQAQRSLLLLGAVESDRGAETTLRLLVKGPHRHDIQIKIAEVDPGDVLQAELGQGTPINDGAVYMFPLKVSVPAGARPVTRIGTDQTEYGRILIETTHPIAKSVPVYVRFAVK